VTPKLVVDFYNGRRKQAAEGIAERRAPGAGQAAQRSMSGQVVIRDPKKTCMNRAVRG